LNLNVIIIIIIL